MMPVIRLSDATYRRLQAHAEPFVDTPVSVIERILDEYEGMRGTAQTIGMERNTWHVLDPDTPGNLHHTRVTHARVDGVDVRRPNWNGIVHVVHQLASQKGVSLDALRKITLSNVVKGEENERGFHYLPEIDISVQSVDANMAWRNALHLAKRIGVPLEVSFEWYTKEGAAHPGEKGTIAWKPR